MIGGICLISSCVASTIMFYNKMVFYCKSWFSNQLCTTHMKSNQRHLCLKDWTGYKEASIQYIYSSSCDIQRLLLTLLFNVVHIVSCSHTTSIVINPVATYIPIWWHTPSILNCKLFLAFFRYTIKYISKKAKNGLQFEMEGVVKIIAQKKRIPSN